MPRPLSRIASNDSFGSYQPSPEVSVISSPPAENSLYRILPPPPADDSPRPPRIKRQRSGVETASNSLVLPSSTMTTTTTVTHTVETTVDGEVIIESQLSSLSISTPSGSGSPPKRARASYSNWTSSSGSGGSAGSHPLSIPAFSHVTSPLAAHLPTGAAPGTLHFHDQLTPTQQQILSGQYHLGLRVESGGNPMQDSPPMPYTQRDPAFRTYELPIVAPAPPAQVTSRSDEGGSSSSAPPAPRTDKGKGRAPALSQSSSSRPSDPESTTNNRAVFTAVTNKAADARRRHHPSKSLPGPNWQKDMGHSGSTDEHSTETDVPRVREGRGRDNQPHVQFQFREPRGVYLDGSADKSAHLDGGSVDSRFQPSSLELPDSQESPQLPPPPPNRERQEPDTPPRASTSTAAAAPATSRSSRRKRNSDHLDIYPRPQDRVLVGWGRWRYWPALVQSYNAEASTATVTFQSDLKTRCKTPAKIIRRAEFRVGDKVEVTKRGNGVVVDVGLWEGVVDGGGVLTVRLDTGDEVDVDGTQICVLTRMIMKDWGDRLAVPLEPNLPPLNVKVTGQHAPLPRSKIVRTKESRNVFCGKAFIITGHPSSNFHARKAGFTQDLEHGGGLVVHGWESLFSIPLERKSEGRKTWIEGTQGDVSWIREEEEGIREVLVIADSASQTKKYLLALALGIPCVNYKWIGATLDNPASPPHWRQYLLSAGKSIEFKTHCSQHLDPNWGKDMDVLRNIMQNTVIRKPFAGKSLCIIYQKETGTVRTNARAKVVQEESAFVPRLACAAGATRVESVTSASQISRPVSEYDYIIIGGPRYESIVENLTKDGATCASIAWLKQCVLMGGLQPQWVGEKDALVQDYSQG